MVKTTFSIKDLENLSGIKAHTIRIWEQRYDLFTPQRTNSNIRLYNSKNLIKLLNICYLYNNGYKISKIATLNPKQLAQKTIEISSDLNGLEYNLKAFKEAMLTFNEALFNSTYNQLKAKHSFSYIYTHFFIPLLLEIGMLWQLDSIKPVHERFIAELIKKKLYHESHTLKTAAKNIEDNAPLYVLFLPLNEIHELSLLYIEYELLKHNKHTLYLGANIPIEDLAHFNNLKKEIIFTTYLTIEPQEMSINKFVSNISKTTSSKHPRSLWLFGSKMKSYTPLKTMSNIKTFKTVPEFLKALT